MVDSLYCKTCGRFMLYPDTHKCPPKWEIWDKDCYGDEYQIVYGTDAEEAGEVYAQSYDDDGDYPLTNGGEVEVKIRKIGDEKWETYILSAEPTVNYRAHLKS